MLTTHTLTHTHVDNTHANVDNSHTNVDNRRRRVTSFEHQAAPSRRSRDTLSLSAHGLSLACFHA